MKHFHSKVLFLDDLTFPEELPSGLQFIMFVPWPTGEFKRDLCFIFKAKPTSSVFPPANISALSSKRLSFNSSDLASINED